MSEQLHPLKRPYPFDDQGNSGPPPQRSRPAIVLQDLSEDQQQTLRQAASLLGKSLTELLGQTAVQQPQGLLLPHSDSASSTTQQDDDSPSAGQNKSGGLPANFQDAGATTANTTTAGIAPTSEGRVHGMFSSGPDLDSARQHKAGDQSNASESTISQNESYTDAVQEISRSMPESSSWINEFQAVESSYQPLDPQSAQPNAWNTPACAMDIVRSPQPGSTQALESPPLGPTESSASTFEVIAYEPGKHQICSAQQVRGHYQDQQMREETSLTRKSKACVRCRMQKIRCHPNPNDPTGPCLTCLQVPARKIHTLVCMRYKITECVLYRVGKPRGLDFTGRWPVMTVTKDITNWASTDVHTIHVTSNVSTVPLKLFVRKFIPEARDSLQTGWMDRDRNVKKFKPVEPYAIVNMGKAMEDMKHYINDNVFDSINYVMKSCDPLAQETFAFARRYMDRAERAETKSLLANFFRLWFAIRRTATLEFISGDDKLGMKPEEEDTSFHLFGRVPLPPVMIKQLDMILTLGVLNPLTKPVLEDLQKIFLANRPRSWLTIYLVTFMMLHGCALLSQENYANARKQGLLRRYAMPTFISEHHHAANVLLSHYHYITKPCNPFTMDWKKRQTTRFADFTPEEIHFIQRTKRAIAKKQERFADNREQNLYEDEFYFVGQMFEEDWSPRDTVVDFGDKTVNNVPLKIYYGDPEFEAENPEATSVS